MIDLLIRSLIHGYTVIPEPPVNSNRLSNGAEKIQPPPGLDTSLSLFKL